MEIDKNMFREYDIRGTYGVNLDEEVSYKIGKAYGSYIQKFNLHECIVGRDNRLSSPTMAKSLIDGILSTGVDVIDLGIVTTPMVYYARILKNILSCIMVTASHNPKDDNGYKISFNTKGNAIGKEIYEFRNFLLEGNFIDGNGKLSSYDIKNEYFELYKKNLSFGNRKLKVVVDCANGATSLYAKELYSMFNIDLIMMYDEADGNFPHHHPDPSIESNLNDLKRKVLEERADVGVSFDGDGDRVGFIDEKGNFLPADKYSIIVIRDLINKNGNKKVLYDIKCSRIVSEEVLKLGGYPFENRTGASYLMNRVMDDDMIFGIEYSGHVYYNNGFPPITSGMYAGLKLLEIMSNTDKRISELLEGINEYYSSDEIKVHFDDDVKWAVIDAVKKYAIDKGYNVSLIDGVKVNFNYGWASVRASNTGPNITMRFEANDKEKLEDLRIEFMNLIENLKGD